VLAQRLDVAQGRARSWAPGAGPRPRSARRWPTLRAGSRFPGCSRRGPGGRGHRRSPRLARWPMACETCAAQVLPFYRGRGHRAAGASRSSPRGSTWPRAAPSELAALLAISVAVVEDASAVGCSAGRSRFPGSRAAPSPMARSSPRCSTWAQGHALGAGRGRALPGPWSKMLRPWRCSTLAPGS
jgi:hypothetical protein